MSSLVPGTLFYATGLNRKHTPTPATISNDELSERYARAAFNGRPWPPTSPVAGVYDVRNSSTSLILLNNKRRKESQLRGRSNPRKEEHRYPEPERHSRCSTPVNRDYHTLCLDSSSPYYEPDIELDMDWLNRSQRPANRFAAGSAVNPKRHTSCQVPSNPRAFDIRLHSSRRPTSRTSLPVNFSKSQMGFKELTPGEQRYFASISNIYMNNQMIRLKRRQYIDLLNQELQKGLYTKSEYERYRDYIALGRQRQYLNVSKRVASAPVRRTTFSDTDTDRSYTSYNDEEKSYMSELDTQKSNKKSSATPQATRSKSPDKQRPPSVTSSTSSRLSLGRSSQIKSRSSSAKSTSSVKSISAKSDVSVKSITSSKSDQRNVEKKNSEPIQEKKKSEPIQEKKKSEPIQEKKETEPIPDKQEAEQIPEKKESEKFSDEEQSDKISEKKELEQIPYKKEREQNDETKPESSSNDDTEETDDCKKQEQTSDSDTGVPSDKQYSAREGHGRPKSRLGHIPEDAKSNEEEDTKEEEKSIDKEIKKEFGDEERNEQEKNDTTQDKNESEPVQKYNETKQSSDSDSDSEIEQIKDPDKLPY